MKLFFINIYIMEIKVSIENAKDIWIFFIWIIEIGENVAREGGVWERNLTNTDGVFERVTKF